MREIVLDTETTGLDPKAGHRLVEVAGVELVNHVATGTHRRWYINPERDIPAEAQAVHGLTEEFLKNEPLFAAVAEDFLHFIGDATLVIHNAEFDLKFLNAELARLGKPPLPSSRAVDTVALARAKHPGARVSLDALCQRYGIDNAHRTLHGALLDCELLAEVYLELRGGREPGFGLALGSHAESESALEEESAAREPRPPRPHAPSPEEREAHQAMLGRLTDPIWLDR